MASAKFTHTNEFLNSKQKDTKIDLNKNLSKESLHNFLGFFELLYKIDNRLKKEGNENDNSIGSSD